MHAILRSVSRAFAAALLGAAAAVSATRAHAEDNDDMIDLGRVGLTVMGVNNTRFVNPGAVFPVSAVGPLDATPILARGTTNDMATAELLGYSAGRALSEQEPDYAIGEYCTDFGGRKATDVDWERMKYIVTNDNCRGFVTFVNSFQTGADRRILFTAGGAVDVNWYYKGEKEPVLRTYTIASRTSARPYRLYATRVDEPNEAAYVDLSGKYVEFLGSTNIVFTELGPDPKNPGSTIVVRGIDYDRAGSKRLTYRYTVNTNDLFEKKVECPRGQFVLAYYDTETKANLLATIVVEVVPPTVHTVDATVGSELRPDGGGYDIEGLVATIRDGDKASADDPYAPYIEKFAAPLGMERQSPCHGKVYAIAPTDASTSDLDMPMPWKVDIYWRAPDPMGTLWTFENDWYNITWPKDSLKVVVSGDSSEPGACLTVPTNYSAVVTGYREPATLVVGSTAWGEVLADVEGKFLVKVEPTADPLRVWYLPVETCLREGGRNTHLVRAPRTFDWPVGKELTLVTGEAAGDGEIAGVASCMTSFLPGYVHEKVSTGNNWNPRLYHRPSPADDFSAGIEGELESLDLPAVDVDDDGTNETITATGDTDPYARLTSTVYGVNASDTPIEVWWRGMVFEDGMESPITYPGLVERYRLYWDETPGLFPEIALSSKLGSAGKMGAFAGRSFVFVSTNGIARIYSSDLDGLEEVQAPQDEERDMNGGETAAYHLGLRLMPPEVTDATRTLGLGRILTLANTNGADNAELVLDLEDADPTHVKIVASVLKHVGRRIDRTECACFTLERGKWSSVTLSLPDTFLGDELDFTLGGGGCSALGVAFDDVALWWGVGIARPAEDEYLFNFDFDMDDLETFGPTGLRVAVDANGLTMVVEGGQALDVGTYGEVDGCLYAEGGVAPELYWQNDPKKPGYNPNEEHAFLRQADADETRYVAWALRNDLNLETDPNATPPYVLAMYPRNGRGEMRMYRVVACNADYPEFSCDVIVGQKMVPPAPLGLVEGCSSANNVAYSLVTDPNTMPVMTDRNYEMWARCNGPSEVYYFYKMQPGFHCPSLGDNQLEDGTYVSWMACATEDAREPEDFSMPEIDVNFVLDDGEGANDLGNGFTGPSYKRPRELPLPPKADDLIKNKTLSWSWKANWPSNTVPTMKIGQTLVRSTGNLPDVFNASSMAVLWPVTNTAPVKVIDPTQVRHGGSLHVDANFPLEYGFTLGNAGTCQLRKGKYYFTGLPPSLSDRFYVDANAGDANRMCLVGTWVEKPSGGSYLLPNVLSVQERQAIMGICKTTNKDKINAWSNAVSKLATDYVLPSPYRLIQSKLDNSNQYRYDRGVVIPVAARDAFEAYFKSVQDGKTPGYDIIVDKVTRGEFTYDLTLKLGKKGCKNTAGFAEVSSTTIKTNRTATTADETRYRNVWQKRIPELGKYDWPKGTRPKFAAYDLEYNYLGGTVALKCDYEDHDHYALVADGSCSGWVVLIENDDPDTSRVAEGTPVQMHVLRVLPELFTDGIAVLTDPLNKLSEQLTLHYRTPFGPGVDNFKFDWRRRQPDAVGGIDRNYTNWTEVVKKDDQLGHIDHHLGSKNASAEDYVNNYYTLRYKPDKNSLAYKYLSNQVFKVNGKTYDYTKDTEIWSGWCEPQLAEGWLQRALNTVTPFAQRVDDFYANESDIKYTMFEQIGGPYQGDVALNNDNLANVGLLELYRTMFNRVESILVSGNFGQDKDKRTKSNLCKQLLLAATRIAQFYTFLGADAYADAKNPLISQGRDQFWEQEVPAADYCFANQVPSLLDEELALLRGLTSATTYPNKQEAPCFNRLRWNLTRGLTEGEVAYVNNYGIQSDKGALDVNCAANQYPQGHGDAWGHYLSALSTYYRLIRNPQFDWPVAMGEMLMDQTVANVDYQDEEKFADAVAKLVQTGLDTMALTFRKAYKERGGRSTERGGKSGGGGVMTEVRVGDDGYFDADVEQAFGYGQWATRTGMNAIYGWMAGNALLPSAEGAMKDYKAFVDRGVSKIDRSTAPQLTAVCTLMRNLDQRLNDFEAGLNPLGLSENAVPFDIDPDELSAKNTHFEQILTRAEKALANCRTVLDYANVYGSQLARIQNAEADAATEKETRELEFKQQLIAVFGTPYPEDCGVSGMYAQGYDGPDIYNYNYMDLAEFGIKYPLDTVFTNSYDYYSLKFNMNPSRVTGDKYQQYFVNKDGIRIKPSNFDGKRAIEGSIQAAYRDYLTAYSALKGATAAYERSVAAYDRTYARRVATLTKAVVDIVLGWFTKSMSAKLGGGDPYKMIGAMLAQSFSSADMTFVGTGVTSGTAIDVGEANRVKIFERFYKGYLEKIGLNNHTNSLTTVLAGKIDALRKAERELNVAKTNLTAKTEALAPAQARLKQRVLVLGENPQRTPIGQRVDAQADWNKSEDERVDGHVNEPCCWYWSRNVVGNTELENWVRIKNGRTAYATDGSALGGDKDIKLATFLRWQVAEDTEHWYKVLYVQPERPWGQTELAPIMNAIINEEKQLALAMMAEMKMRSELPQDWDVPEPEIDWGKLTFTSAYTNLLVQEMKYHFDYAAEKNAPNQDEHYPSLKAVYDLYYAAQKGVEKAQKAYDDAKKAYEDEFGGDVNTDDTMHPEAGKGWREKYKQRVSKYFDDIGNDPQATFQFITDLLSQAWGLSTAVLDACTEVQSAALAVCTQIYNIRDKTAELAGYEAVYRAELYKGQEILEARELWRRQFSNNAVQYRYLDMFDRIQRSTALTKYSTAFDTAQRYVWELAKVYDYETGLLSSDRQAGDRFLSEIVGTRSLGREGVSVSSGTTDGGLYDVVARLKANWDVIKPRLGMNNADKPEKWFSLRWEDYRLGRNTDGNARWQNLFKKNNWFERPDGSKDPPIYCDNILADPDFVRYCQPLANAPGSKVQAEPGFIIRFKTSIYNAQNFFGEPLIGGDNQFSAADYATKIDAVGVYFEGYDRAVESSPNEASKVALAKEPNIYLVPIGQDVMRSPAGAERQELRWTVVDQVLPLPYTIGSAELDSVGWISSMVGFDGTSDSGAVIRRHSTLRAGYNFTSTRLVGRSAWNGEWMLVIPASSLNSQYDKALDRFGETVTDIKIGIRAYSRSGN